MRLSANSILILAFVTIITLLMWASYEQGRGRHAATVQPRTTVATTPTVLSAQTSGAKCHMRGELPDPTCTPGAADPRVTQDNLQSTVCRGGYTKTVRPPASYTDRLKRVQIADYGFTGSSDQYEEDHLIPLELGGAPDDPRNLWPEPGASPNAKDRVENTLHTAVCSGRLHLTEAQVRIATDWTTAAVGL